MIEIIETLWNEKNKISQVAEIRTVVEKFSLNVEEHNEKQFETSSGIAIGVLDWFQAQDGKLFLDYVLSESL